MIVGCKGRHLKRKHIWFENYSDTQELLAYKRNCDEIIVHANPISLQGKNIKCETQESLITDLRQDSTDILQQFSKTVRNELSRAEREQVECVFCDSDMVLKNGAILEQMAEMYQMMYESKGMHGVHLSDSELQSYAENSRLLISYAVIDHEICVFHSYVFDDGNCRLLHSCSEFRVEDNQKRNAIGRANKLLHWKDMLKFQQLGVEHYDWGGIHSFSNPNGIDKFKMSFGGTPTSYYNIYCPCSIKMKLYGVLRNIKKCTIS